MSTVMAMSTPSILASSALLCGSLVFFFNDTATTEIYTLSLHDALPISQPSGPRGSAHPLGNRTTDRSERCASASSSEARSEEHTSELQSQSNLVCRLLLEKKKKNNKHFT